MPLRRVLRRRAGALLYDMPRFEATLRGLGPYRRLPFPWVAMRNRNERITLDGRGARCEWVYGSDLHVANVFASAGRALLRRALRDWPIELRANGPERADAPQATFIIGHRGLPRLPLLLLTLQTIAAQREAAVECVVVEQSVVPEIASALPSWVRHVHLPVAATEEYSRSSAFNAGARVARGEVLVLHDNDMLCPVSYARETIARVREGFRFLQLKRFVFYLSEGESRDVLARRNLRGVTPSPVVQNVHGGSLATTRNAYFEIGGFDESFVGWGGEDNEFWDRAEFAGPVYDFGYLPFVHLWHEPQKGKLSGSDAPAVRRWQELKDVPAQERIRLLRSKLTDPSAGSPAPV